MEITLDAGAAGMNGNQVCLLKNFDDAALGCSLESIERFVANAVIRSVILHDLVAEERECLTIDNRASVALLDAYFSKSSFLQLKCNSLTVQFVVESTQFIKKRSKCAFQRLDLVNVIRKRTLAIIVFRPTNITVTVVERIVFDTTINSTFHLPVCFKE